MSALYPINTEPTEHQEQAAFFDWIDHMGNRFPYLKNIWANTNAGKRSYGALRYYKNEGLRSGVPDITVAIPKAPYHGLFIEMKRPNKKPTKNQADYLDNLSKFGYLTKICFSAQEAIDVVKEYLHIK